MSVNPDEKTTLFGKDPCRSKRHSFLFQQKFARKEGINQHSTHTLPCSDDSSIVSSEYSTEETRVTVRNFGKNFMNHLLGTETGEEKKRQMCMSKFILVVDDAFDDDEEEQASVMETKKQDLLAELLDEVKAAESALWFLWKFPENKTQDPNTYLQAASEVTALTLGLSWILTFIFNPSVIANNPLYDRLGYNNVCVGWDTFPANIVGVLGISIAVHLGLRFVHLNESRAKLLGDKLSERSKTYGLISNKAFALALVMMPIIFAVPPTISVYAHSLPFLFFVVASAAVLLGRFILFQDELSQTKAIYICIFSFVSFMYPVVLLREYRYYDVYGEKSPWPGMLTMTIDYSWFFLLSLMPIMLPQDIVLLRDYKLGYRPKQF